MIFHRCDKLLLLLFIEFVCDKMHSGKHNKFSPLEHSTKIVKKQFFHTAAHAKVQFRSSTIKHKTQTSKQTSTITTMAKIVCGGHTGMLKVIDVNQQRIVAEYGRETQAMNKSITHMTWAHPNVEDEVMFARRDGTIESVMPFLNLPVVSSEENYDGENNSSNNDSEDDEIGEGGDEKKKALLPITQLESNFVINRFQFFEENKKPEASICGLYSENISDSRRNVYCVTEKGKFEMYTIENYRTNDESQRTISLSKKIENFSEGTHVHKMIGAKINESTTELAYGGKNSLLKIYDVNAGKCTFRAQNDPKTDKSLQLREPVYVRDICYMNLKENYGQIVCIATGYGQVRFYDRRASRLPFLTKKLSESAFSCIDASPIREKEVIAGGTMGGLHRVDYSTSQTGRKNFVFKGMAGAVTQVQYHASGDYIACSGADRFIRLYNARDRSLEKSFYLIQRQGCFLMSSEPVELPDEDDEGSDNEIKRKKTPQEKPGFVLLGPDRKRKRADDEVWDNLENEEKKQQKKNKKDKKPKKGKSK